MVKFNNNIMISMVMLNDNNSIQKINKLIKNFLMAYFYNFQIVDNEFRKYLAF